MTFFVTDQFNRQLIKGSFLFYYEAKEAVSKIKNYRILSFDGKEYTRIETTFESDLNYTPTEIKTNYDNKKILKNFSLIRYEIKEDIKIKDYFEKSGKIIIECEIPDGLLSIKKLLEIESDFTIDILSKFSGFLSVTNLNKYIL